MEAEVASPIVLASTRDLVPAGLAAFADDVVRRLDAGERLVSLFGRPEGDDEVLVTAVLRDLSGRLALRRGRGQRDGSYPSITRHHPAAQAFERELWEQTGLVPAGHPWLKPVRHEGAHEERMRQYPFFTVRGQEVHEVGVGPIHASVIEPGHFRFMCHGEQVHHLELQLGYQHRGVESLLLRRPPQSLAPLVETLVGDSSIAYAWGHCAAVEALTGHPASAAAERVRGVALELERIAMHLATLGGMATDIAFLQGGATYGRLRTAIINATMRACGSRFGRGWLRPGGVRRGIDDSLREDLRATLAAFDKDKREVDALMLGARSVRSRLRGTGVLDRRAATETGIVGLAARASGVPGDARTDLPGEFYAAHPVATFTEEGGDCLARMSLRMREIDESVRWILRMLATQDLRAEGIDHAAASRWPLLADALCVTVREGFRGPVLQALETGPEGRLVHYKVQDPSLANWFGVALAVRGNGISDFPICNKSFDLSYCGNDL